MCVRDHAFFFVVFVSFSFFSSSRLGGRVGRGRVGGSSGSIGVSVGGGGELFRRFSSKGVSLIKSVVKPNSSRYIEW